MVDTALERGVICEVVENEVPFEQVLRRRESYKVWTRLGLHLRLLSHQPLYGQLIRRHEYYKLVPYNKI